MVKYVLKCVLKTVGVILAGAVFGYTAAGCADEVHRSTGINGEVLLLPAIAVIAMLIWKIIDDGIFNGLFFEDDDSGKEE